MNEDTTFGFPPGHMADLLGIGVAGEEQSGKDAAETKAELLRARFAGPLPLETTVIEALPALIGKLCQNLLPLGGKSLKEVLLDEETDLQIIEQIKDYGKKLAKRDDESDQAVGIAVYYTAIASALLFHRQKITQHPYSYLRDSFEAMDKNWMPGDLARHIMKAHQICRKRPKP